MLSWPPSYARVATLACLLVSCGRTGLQLASPPDPDDGGRPALGDAGRDAGAEPDAGDPDAGLPPLPPCGADVSVGEERFRVPGLAGAPVFGDDGTLYAPMLNDDDRSIDLAAYARCTGEELWRQPAIGPASPTAVRYPSVRRTSADDLVLVNTEGFFGAYGIFRFNEAGERQPDYELRSRINGFYAIPRGAGPVLRELEELERRTVTFDVDGRRTGTWPFDAAPQEECGATRDALYCFDVAYRLATGEELWRREGGELIDGVIRKVVGPALADGRAYVVLYGISAYDFVAVELETGRLVFRVPLMRTTQGQADLRIGRPVVGEDGTVYVYAHGTRTGAPPPGRLTAFDPDGSERWVFGAPATSRAFFVHDTHLVGDAGLVYLAIGEAVSAVEAATGALRWRLAVPERVDTAHVTLSRAGDLAVRTNDDQLIVIATESRGLARSPWPAPAGSVRQANDR
ncbi:MAG: PQQ-binding-like beta-propeller repeat protein [Sandaracinaceae bacterium]